MNRILIAAFISFFWLRSESQNNAQIVNTLPDFILPTPEASAMLKADNLSVGYTTGSPNINIPLFNFRAAGYSLPISLNYSSTGVKVDDQASMVGMGWALNYGGVVSRVVFDQPDESRDEANCNLTSGIDITVENATLMNFLTNAPDKQSDIFTFSLPGYSGKFIIGLTNDECLQLTKNNLKIQSISNNFLNGFIITTDDGTAYHFEDAETSTERNPSGSNCEKTFGNTNIKTSWYLTKIVLPSTTKQIDFTYTTANITFSSSITQTINKVTWTGTYPCATSPTGNACVVGSERFSTCINQQTVTSKFITKIQSSDGDKVEFFYDGTLRTDLQNGKRLSSMKVTNRNGHLVSSITFTGSYQNAVNSTSHGTTYDNKRLFLDQVEVRGGEITAAASPIYYSFYYESYNSLPARFTYGQDMYGYYNGKNSNASLIPTLPSGDVNYATFSNGTGAALVTFGDRSIDQAYSKKGLLTKIVYPTGGYDEIEYMANLKSESPTVYAGGHSVSKIKSYTFESNKVLEREFLYRYYSNSSISTFLLTSDLVFSQLNTVKKDGYICSPSTSYSEGPECNYAVVTSNAVHPIATFGGQHVYHKSVLEKIIDGSNNNGLIEHTYQYILSGDLHPRNRLGNPILNAPFQIVPDMLVGEQFTNVYKYNGVSFDMVKSTERVMRVEGLDEYSNFVVKKNYTYTNGSTPPGSAEFDVFDVDEVYINTYTIRTDEVIEKDYLDNSLIVTKTTEMEYDPDYTYPKVIVATGSDEVVTRIERKYPPDIPNTVMVNRNIISPVLEEKQYKVGSPSNTLLLTKTQTWSDWFSNSTVVAPQHVELKLYSNTQTQKVTFYGYDMLGNPQQLSKEDDQKVSYIWDYGRCFPIAKVVNADSAKIAYTSFEADGNGGWTLGGTNTVLTQGGITGKNSFNGQAIKTVASGNYIVSAWTKGSATVTVNSTSGTLLRTLGEWKLYEWSLTSVTSITVVGTNFDELRLFPKEASMTTFSYVPLVGVTAQIDANNRISYFEYDGMSRLMLVRDEESNILKKICYNYAGQTEACNVYYNSSTNRSIARNNCSTGYTGSNVTYTVPSGRYSGYTQADADAKAETEIDTYGQAYANANGTCTVTCTTGNCTGVDKKCVNNICETGEKVYTSVTQIGPHLWECTYHYEWSDGSWSQNYTEQHPNSMSCMPDL